MVAALSDNSVDRKIFFVINILMFDSAWCLVMTQIQFSLIKKNTRYPHPLRPIISHFYFTTKPTHRSNLVAIYSKGITSCSAHVA